MRKLKLPFGIMTLCLGWSLVTAGQPQQTAQSTGGQSTAQPQAKTKEEHEAYVTFYQEKEPQKKVELGNKFLVDYATSEFKPNVILLMIQSQQASGSSKGIIDLGGKFLNEFPQHSSRPFVLQALMVASQGTNDLARTVDYGEKLLQVDPNNLTALYTIPFILSERSISSDEAGRKKELARAAEVAQQGLSMAKPAQLTDDQWIQYQAVLHSSLGLIHLNNKEYAEAQSEYAKATSVIKNDPILYFRSGLAFSFDKKYDEAIDALSKSVYLKGITETQAKTELERVYRIKNGITTSGPELQAAIQKVVDEAGTKLK
jgi:tetratricopeptide (TPR) repeat protein